VIRRKLGGSPLSGLPVDHFWCEEDLSVAAGRDGGFTTSLIRYTNRQVVTLVEVSNPLRVF
jgi:hypothetical protein